MEWLLYINLKSIHIQSMHRDIPCIKIGVSIYNIYTSIIKYMKEEPSNYIKEFSLFQISNAAYLISSVDDVT